MTFQYIVRHGHQGCGSTFVSFNGKSVPRSSNMARSVRWPWCLLILILSLPREHGVGASAAPGDSCNSHASSAEGKIVVEIIGGLLSGVIFVGALYRLAAEVAPPLRFFICHTGGINKQGKNFPKRLYDEMTQSWKLKFFIDVFLDARVLRDGVLFPLEILKELERTQVGIVLVTPEFFTRKWPMVELVYFVESSERSSNMRRVLPLFYSMTVRQVQNNLRDGVWEAEWRKMSTHGDHPSVERCRHAVDELCKYKGVEYIYDDRGRDEEYIREILKCVGKIVCEEIRKSDRAKDSVNSLLRGHAPERSGEVIELAPPHEPEPLSPQPLPMVAPPPVATPSSSLRDNRHLAPDIYLSLQTSPPEPEPPLTVASPPPVVAPWVNFSDDDHSPPDNLPAPHAPPLGPEPPIPQPLPLHVAHLPHVVAPSPSFNNDIYLASIIFLASQAPLSRPEPSNLQHPPPVAPPPPVITPSPSFNNDDHLACDIYLAPQTPPHELEPLSPQPPDVAPSPSSFSSPPSSFSSPRRRTTRFPRRLRVFISHAGGGNQGRKIFPEKLYDEMKKSWKLKVFIRVFVDQRRFIDNRPFPTQIIEELDKTDFGIVLITEDFFTQKLSMLELVAFVESRERSDHNKWHRLLPLFYRMTPKQVRDNLKDGVWEGSWTEMSTQGNHPLSVERCRHAVARLCNFNGVVFRLDKYGDAYEGEYIREIVKRVEKLAIEEMWWKMLIELLSW